MKKWRLRSSTIVFDRRWFRVRQDTVVLPNGRVIDDYFVWPEGDVALVVPVTEQGDVILVRQYKHAAQEIMVEFPAGMLEPDEVPLQGAQRELREETGYVSDQSGSRAL
jgi:ADP-ribose pyrophosphatase